MWTLYGQYLQAHDWLFHTSSDTGAIRAGDEQSAQILKISEKLRKIDKDRTENMYNNACPWFDCYGHPIDF